MFFTSAFRLKAVLQTLTWVLKRPLVEDVKQVEIRITKNKNDKRHF